jgi:AraC-like DNA-binding protein
LSTGPGVHDSVVAVTPELAPYVRLIWGLDVDRPAAFGAPERILPDGVVEAVFHYGTPLAMRFPGEDFGTLPRSCLVSLTRRWVEIRPPAPTGFLAVRFHPWGAHHFFDPPVSELEDRAVPAGEVWGRDALELEERLQAASGASQRAHLLRRFLRDRLRLDRREPADSLVRAVWSNRGQTRLSRLCRELGVSERRLERTFQRAVGVAPKHCARLARFLHACRLMHKGGWRTLTEVAHAAGYYDQAHCIAEFQEFAGMTPRAFLAAEKVAFETE